MEPQPNPTSGAKRKADNGKAIGQAVKSLITSQMRAPFYQVEEGIINILRQCLISDQQGISTSALSGHVDHFQSLHDDDFGWGCGWRNIQILCSFLLSQDSEAGEALFHGAKFVPNIPALQQWLEIAWMKGFDSSGAEYYNGQIHRTQKWIGTTECAALLRSFGVRAMIVSFTVPFGDQTESAVGCLGRSGEGGYEPDEDYEKSISKEISMYRNLYRKSASSKTHGQEFEESSPHRSTPQSLLHSHYELFRNTLEKMNLSSTTDQDSEDDTDDSRSRPDFDSAANSGVGPDRKVDSERQAERGRGNFSDSDVEWGAKCSSCRVRPTRGPRYRSLLFKCWDLCVTCLKSIMLVSGGFKGRFEDFATFRLLPPTRIPPEFASAEYKHVQNRNDKGGTGEDESTWQQGEAKILHHHLIQWVWNYFYGPVSEGSTSASPSPRQPVTISNRSPLYFQHRGHSRTIVGIEHRQVSDGSEEINLLVLDPSQRTETLAETLRSRIGWRKLIAHDVRSLRESEYQICFVEEGTARDEELETLKVLKSLNYKAYPSNKKRN